jgi:serine/threonine-protein kinase
MTDEPILTIDHAGERRTLRPGDALAFGRAPASASATGDEPHLGLSANPRLHQRAGLVEVDGAGWVLTNTGRWLHLRVVEVGGPNRLDLQPGRAARVPYARCRIEATTGDETVGFRADCPFLDRGPGVAEPAQAGSTVQGLGLDREAGYFRALVALCAPRLRNPQSDEVAPVGEIVRVLNRASGEPERVTAKAVERRLAHVRRKLGIGATDAYGGSAAGLEVRDAARLLADLVLRTGAVTAADLAILGDPAAPAAASETPA